MHLLQMQTEARILRSPDAGDLMYCYPNTNVLKNKLGITNPNKLHDSFLGEYEKIETIIRKCLRKI